MVKLYNPNCIFPSSVIENTAKFYVEKMGFRAVPHLDVSKLHILLDWDATEIILTRSNGNTVIPNRELYGYGCAAYFITDPQKILESEFSKKA